jgi:hypothetical protein
MDDFAEDNFAAFFSADNEYRARSAIRALLQEHHGNRFTVEAKLSIWIMEEYRAWLGPSAHKDNTP